MAFPGSVSGYKFGMTREEVGRLCSRAGGEPRALNARGIPTDNPLEPSDTMRCPVEASSSGFNPIWVDLRFCKAGTLCAVSLLLLPPGDMDPHRTSDKMDGAYGRLRDKYGKPNRAKNGDSEYVFALKSCVVDKIDASMFHMWRWERRNTLTLYYSCSMGRGSFLGLGQIDYDTREFWAEHKSSGGGDNF